jgi:hypothetical protein
MDEDGCPWRITFIPWKETEQFHILYATIDPVSDSNLNMNLNLNLKLESESKLESETVEWIVPEIGDGNTTMTAKINSFQ